MVKRMLHAIETKDQSFTAMTTDGLLRLEISKFIPDEGPRQTIAQRRKRVRQALNEELRIFGCVVTPRWIVQPT
jgi:hypothetical protein